MASPAETSSPHSGSTVQRPLRELRRRVAFATFFGTLSMHVLVALLVGGSTALLLRLFGLSPSSAALALSIVAVTPLSAWLVSRRRFLSEAGAAAWLDVRAGATGAVVTEFEVGDERWSERAQAAVARAGKPPTLRLSPLVGRPAAGAAFVALALFVPVPSSIAGPPQALYDTSIDRLREKLETLEEAIEFDDTTVAELQEQLERLEEDAQRVDNPEAMFEAIDQFSDRLEAEAQDAQDIAEMAAEEMDDAADLADSDPAGAQDKLEAALERLTDEGLKLGLPSDLADELGIDPLLEGLDLPEGQILDPSQLKNLSEEMQKLLAEKLQALADAGLLDFGEFADFGDLAAFDGEFSDLTLAELADLELCEDCKAGEP